MDTGPTATPTTVEDALTTAAAALAKLREDHSQEHEALQAQLESERNSGDELKKKLQEKSDALRESNERLGEHVTLLDQERKKRVKGEKALIEERKAVEAFKERTREFFNLKVTELQERSRVQREELEASHQQQMKERSAPVASQVAVLLQFGHPTVMHRITESTTVRQLVERYANHTRQDPATLQAHHESSGRPFHAFTRFE